MITKHINIKDGLMLGLSGILIALSIAFAARSGIFTISLAEDEQLTWHLIRSSGMFAYILLTASMVWGLFLSNKLIKDWSPGPVSMSIHSTLSWLGIGLTLVHALLLMVDDYFTYTLHDVFVPFAGPYRPEWVGFGTLGFWLMLIVTISFAFQKRMGQTTWKRLHYTSYLVYAMATLHGLFSGTDSELLGFRMMVGIGVMVVVLLTIVRIARRQPSNQPRQNSAGAVTTRSRRAAAKAAINES